MSKKELNLSIDLKKNNDNSCLSSNQKKSQEMKQINFTIDK